MGSKRRGWLSIVAAILTLAIQAVALAGQGPDVSPRLSPDGFRTIRIGMAVAEASRALAGGLVPHGSQQPNPECYYGVAATGPSGIYYMVVNGRIARIDIEAGQTATDRGARIGDSETRIKALYPGIMTKNHAYRVGHYLIYNDKRKKRGIVFETDGHDVTSFHGGDIPVIYWPEGCS